MGGPTDEPLGLGPGPDCLAGRVEEGAEVPGEAAEVLSEAAGEGQAGALEGPPVAAAAAALLEPEALPVAEGAAPKRAVPRSTPLLDSSDFQKLGAVAEPNC